MSHLTANPFQKHYEFPRPGPLLTPPETEPEYPSQSSSTLQSSLPSSQLSSGQAMPNGLGIDLDPSPTPRGRSSPVPDPLSIRKVSSLQYINTGPREARERAEKRGMKWLVVVVPPASLTQEHGHLGHTLSVGSPDRLSQGILMPLYSTMTTQLVAIAREFAFPSTSGLCLYLHTSFSGTPVTPRISDESWQLLWGHLFDPKSPALQHTQLPIGGKIEFDIDLSKARWYEAWIGMGRRENIDVPVSVTPSRAGSPAHWRADSKTSFMDDQTETPDESLDLLHLGRHSRGPSLRHIPKKLSLLDRLENVSTRSASKLGPRLGSPPSPRQETRHPLSLSPIVQGNSEPSSAKKDIDKFVNSWRASATISTSPLHATGQTSLDPINMPNDLPIDSPSSPDEHAESVLDLEDFQWSVTSMGPPDYDDDDLESVASWRIPSVHLDRRLEGSVCLTPTTCTSFGPPDWDVIYEPSVAASSRVASPDIAMRMLEDCPVTPSTATTWGPPLSWPATPATPYHVHTPDVGQRAFDEAAPPRQFPRTIPEEVEEQPWRNVWPYNSVAATTTEGEGASASPYTFTFPRRPSSPPAETQEAVARSAGVEEEGSSRPFPLVWPYYSAAQEAAEPTPAVQVTEPSSEPAQPSSMVWPYYSAAPAEPAPQPAAGASETAPLQQEEVAVHVEEPVQPSSMGWPYYAPRVEDAEDAAALVQETRAIVDDAPPVPPTRAPKPSPFKFVIAAAAPIAAAVAVQDDEDEDQVPEETVPEAVPEESGHEGAVPEVHLHEEATPTDGQFDEPAPRKQRTLQELMDADSESEFSEEEEEEEEPFIRPPPTPTFTQNWSLFGMSMDVSVSVDVVVEDRAHHEEEERVYVDDDYAWDEEDHRVYVDDAHVRDYEEESVVPEAAVAEPIVVEQAVAKQVVEDVPVEEAVVEEVPVKKAFVEEVIAQDGVRETPVTLAPVCASVKYPYFNIYPAVYPYLELYPEAPGALEAKTFALFSPISSLPYPAMSIYAPVYPNNVQQLYPSIHVDKEPRIIAKEPLQEITSQLTGGSTHSSVYASIYPYRLNFHYPAEVDPVRLPAKYPAFDIYPPVYPYSLEQIYPPTMVPSTGDGFKAHSNPRSVDNIHSPVSRPVDVSPATTLPQDSAPTTQMPVGKRVTSSLPVQLPATYPRINLYPAVYPHLDLYPAVTAQKLQKVEHTSVPKHGVERTSAELPDAVAAPVYAPRQKPRYTHADLHDMVADAALLHEPKPTPVRRDSAPSILEEEEPIDFGPGMPQEPVSFRQFNTPTIPEEDEDAPEPRPSRIRTPSLSSETEFSASLSRSSSMRSSSSPQVSSRRLPVPTPPPQSVSPAPSPPSSIRSRGRSGTVSARPALPPPPAFAPPMPAMPPVSSPKSDSPSRSARKLPAIPGEAPTKDLPPPPTRPQSMRPAGLGLPSDPAVGRRASALGISRPPPFAPLPPVPEPNAVGTSALSAPALRTQPQPGSPEQGSQSATLPVTKPLDGAADLSRSQSVPSRAPTRARHGSVVASSGIVAGLAKNWDASGGADPALSSFPSPPRAPLPPIPNSRPVSKLDRSKYPFA